MVRDAGADGPGPIGHGRIELGEVAVARLAGNHQPEPHLHPAGVGAVPPADSVGRGRQVAGRLDPVGQHRPQAELAGRGHQRGDVVGGVDVGADEAGRAALHHLQRAQPVGGAGVGRVAVAEVRIDPVAQERDPVEVVGGAPEERLVGVGVGVDETGDGDHAAPRQDLGLGVAARCGPPRWWCRRPQWPRSITRRSRSTVTTVTSVTSST